MAFRNSRVSLSFDIDFHLVVEFRVVVQHVDDDLESHSSQVFSFFSHPIHPLF